MARTIGILQPAYLPWLGFFEQMARSDVFVLYDDVPYNTGSWRNRNRIRTPEGWIWLTVPVLTKGRSGQRIDETEVKANGWQDKHLRSIRAAYAKAAYFAELMPTLEALLSQDWRLLAELDIALIGWMRERLGIRTEVLRSSALNLPFSGRNQRLIDICRHLGANVFYEGAAGSAYIETEKFAAAGVEVVYQSYAHPEYPQLHRPFVPYLSALDALMCLGPETVGGWFA